MNFFDKDKKRKQLTYFIKIISKRSILTIADDIIMKELILARDNDAFVNKDAIFYYLNNEFHRTDGPAVIYYNMSCQHYLLEWWKNGNKYQSKQI